MLRPKAEPVDVLRLKKKIVLQELLHYLFSFLGLGAMELIGFKHDLSSGTFAIMLEYFIYVSDTRGRIKTLTNFSSCY